MSAVIRRFGPVVAIAVVASVVTTTGPVVAKGVYDAVNAHKVDGKHAVGAGTSPTRRAGKLVATNSKGRLPDNIIISPSAVASGTRNAGSLTGDEAAVASVTFKAPGSGYVKITAQSEFNAGQTGSYIGASIVEGTNRLRYNDWDPGDVDGWYDQSQTLTTIVPVTAGTHTYTLTLSENGGGATYAAYYDAQLFVEFVRTKMGGVTPKPVHAKPVNRG